MEQSAKCLRIFLFLGVIALFILSFSLIYFLTLAFDEAWLLSHYQEMFRGEKFEYKMTPSSFTNGGVFALTGMFLYSLFGMHPWVFRFVSYISLVVISCILWKWSMRRWDDKSASLIVLSVFLGMWGSVELSAIAYGCYPAFMLLLIGLSFHVSVRESENNRRPYFLTGLFLGLASASRLNFLPIFPALIFEGLLCSEDRKKKVLGAVAISLIGCLFFLISEIVLVYFSPDTLSELIGMSLSSTGLEQVWLDYPRILNKWIVANGFLPIFIMAGITAYGFIDTSRYSRVMRVLVIFGWLHWFSWLIRSPIAHLRYLWPTIAAFGVVGGFGLAAFYVWAKDSSRKVYSCVALGVALVFTAHGFINGFRSLLHGEANILSWEWSRETPLSDYRWIRYQPNQKQMADYLSHHVEKGEEVGAIGLDLELELMSGVKVVPMSYYIKGDHWSDTSLPKKLLITPMIGTYLYLDPSLLLWMDENLQKEAQFGRYILYRVEGPYPHSPDMFRFSHQPHPRFPQMSSIY